MDKIETATILIIDDEINILHALKRLLAPLGHNILTFDSPVEALKAIKSKQPEVIISDEKMPDMSGVELITQSRKASPFSERIMITAHMDSTLIIDAINLSHVHYFFHKPWDEATLTLAIKNGVANAISRKKSYTLDALLKRQNNNLKEENSELNKLLETEKEKLDAAYIATINTLVRIINSTTDLGSDNIIIADLCDLMAKQINLSHTSRRALNYAALLRNIGKVRFDEELKLKLKTNIDLTEHDQTAFKKHPIYAKTMLSLLPPLSETADILYQQEERCDGTGFPRQLSENDIRIEAKILAMVASIHSAVSNAKKNRDIKEQQLIEEITKIQKDKYDDFLLKKFKVIYHKHLICDEGDKPKTTTIPAHALSPGMKVAKDFCSESGILMLSKNTTLNQITIEHILSLQEKNAQPLSLEIYL